MESYSPKLENDPKYRRKFHLSIAMIRAGIACDLGYCYWCKQLIESCVCSLKDIRQYKQKLIRENLPRELERVNLHDDA